MQLVVLVNDDLKDELLAQGVKNDVQAEWINRPGDFLQYPQADAYIDLLFDYSPERIVLLKKLPANPVFINAVSGSLKELPGNFIRCNGWQTFLKRQLLEAAAPAPIRVNAETIISCFNKKISWVADVPGFISARVVAMIINEAWFALSEGVSTKEETDIAMKSGTNYPYGPFEWGEKIGLKNILTLLQELTVTETRYQPAALLKKEVNH